MIKSAVFAAALALFATGQTTPPSIDVPSGAQLLLSAKGEGSQVYTCTSGHWALKAPDAKLFDQNGKQIGTHFAGPTWKLKDGSEVTGKAVAHVDSLDAQSIPWLLVKVVSHSGTGQLANVTSIQRVHTHGGQPPAEGCDAAHRDAETKSAYTADYYFYAPAK